MVDIEPVEPIIVYASPDKKPVLEISEPYASEYVDKPQFALSQPEVYDHVFRLEIAKMPSKKYMKLMKPAEPLKKNNE